MTANVPPPGSAPGSKADPDELTLRAQPRAVTRLNRRVLMVLAGALILFVFGATMLALDPPSFRGGQVSGEELYNVRNKPTAEGLSDLPRTYGDLPPRLGAPLPGDLGDAVLNTEEGLGLSPPPASSNPDLPFRPNAEDDALRAERIRQARQDQEARESDVFFKVSVRPQTDDRSATAQAVPSPFLPESLGPAAGASTSSSSLDLDRQNDQNLQGHKLAFLDQAVDPDIYNPHALQDPASPYQVMAGTIIPASLVAGINSDLPGQVIAQVTENVHDTVTGRYLLIPQGTRLLGAYDSVVAFGQERALVVWNRIILPDGSSVVIENLPATDTAGYAGLEDEVDFHTWQLIKGIVLSTLLGVGTELTFGEEEGDLVRALRESTQDGASQVGQRLTDRNLNIQPTITIRPGWPLRVIVNKDLILRPYRG